MQLWHEVIDRFHDHLQKDAAVRWFFFHLYFPSFNWSSVKDITKMLQHDFFATKEANSTLSAINIRCDLSNVQIIDEFAMNRNLHNLGFRIIRFGKVISAHKAFYKSFISKIEYLQAEDTEDFMHNFDHCFEYCSFNTAIEGNYEKYLSFLRSIITKTQNSAYCFSQYMYFGNFHNSYMHSKPFLDFIVENIHGPRVQFFQNAFRGMHKLNIPFLMYAKTFDNNEEIVSSLSFLFGTNVSAQCDILLGNLSPLNGIPLHKIRPALT